MPRKVARTCECCEQKFYVADRGDMYSVTGDHSLPTRTSLLCEVCRYHQGDALEKALKRHQEHEQVLRTALAAAAAYAVKAEREVKQSREQVGSALRSRDRAIEKLQAANDLHAMRPNGTCSCGTHNCRTAKVLYDPWLQGLITKADKRRGDDTY